MRYINKSKPIRFSLLVGGKECLVVADVKKNFNLSDLYDSLMNQNLVKWLLQIGETDLFKKIEDIPKTDVLTQKICLYNLFVPQKLSLDSPNIDTVKELLVKRCITFDDLKDTPYGNNIELKKAVIDKIDNKADKEIVNRWCESDFELLKYVYSKKSYNVLNERNCRTLIDKKIVTDEDLILEIAIEKNLDDIFERYEKSTQNRNRVINSRGCEEKLRPKQPLRQPLRIKTLRNGSRGDRRRKFCSGR